MKRLCCWILGLVAILSSVAAFAQQPNVVFILADDLGWADIGANGSRYHKTPNIDRLAKSGMLMTNYYSANPLCSPTRASILTGLYPARLGVTAPNCHLPEAKLEATLVAAAPPTQKALQQVSATRLKTSYPTLAKSLREAGYVTGHFGKWHLGPEPYSALQQGFEVDLPHYPGPGPAGSYVAPWAFPPALEFKPRKPGEHLEDRMADEACDFLRRNRSKKFFLNYWAFSVHAPYDAKDALVESYRPSIDPASGQRNPVYAAMVQSLDEAVGKLLDTLDSEGLTKNTLVVFTSDNGGVDWKGHGKSRFPEMVDTAPTSNAPLRGGKATLYEGGTRVPGIVSWPGKIRAGSRSEALFSSVDWFPTLLEAVGVKAPEARLDGVSQYGVLMGKKSVREEAFVFFPHYVAATNAIPGTWVRVGDWKLIRFHVDAPDGKDRFELYDLRKDPSEATNLASAEPKRVEELNARIQRFLTETRAVVPIANPNFGRAPGNVLGWRTSKDAQIANGPDGLVILSTGNDPFLSTGTFGLPSGAISVQIRVRSSASGQGQFFWQERGVEPPFIKNRSVALEIKHDGAWNEVSAKFEANQPVIGIRLDPATAPGKIELAWIRIFDPKGKMIREWQFTKAPTATASFQKR